MPTLLLITLIVPAKGRVFYGQYDLDPQALDSWRSYFTSVMANAIKLKQSLGHNFIREGNLFSWRSLSRHNYLSSGYRGHGREDRLTLERGVKTGRVPNCPLIERDVPLLPVAEGGFTSLRPLSHKLYLELGEVKFYENGAYLIKINGQGNRLRFRKNGQENGKTSSGGDNGKSQMVEQHNIRADSNKLSAYDSSLGQIPANAVEYEGKLAWVDGMGFCHFVDEFGETIMLSDRHCKAINELMGYPTKEDEMAMRMIQEPTKQKPPGQAGIGRQNPETFGRSRLKSSSTGILCHYCHQEIPLDRIKDSKTINGGYMCWECLKYVYNPKGAWFIRVCSACEKELSRIWQHNADKDVKSHGYCIPCLYKHFPKSVVDDVLKKLNAEKGIQSAA